MGTPGQRREPAKTSAHREAPTRSWVALARRHPSAVLLTVQLLGVILYPLLDGVHGGRELLAALGLAVLGASLWMVRHSPAATWLGALLALAVIALAGVDAVAPGIRLDAVISAFEAAFYFYAAVALIRYMMEDQRATTDELFAAGATFTVLAWAFAHLYTVCQALVPGAFGTDAAARSWMELLFLSFTTLSGVGLGDIVPTAGIARALVMLEQFSGVMYIALVVSRLIAMTLTRR